MANTDNKPPAIIALEKEMGIEIENGEYEVDAAGEITYLCLDGRGIKDISALSSLENLTELVVARNQISDISALSSLVNLTELKLWGNQIIDISALSSLDKLTELSLDYNEISDISALSSLRKLTKLNLGSNQIRDISALSSLDKLTTLYLYNNQIYDISPLSSLTNQLVTIQFEDNPVSKDLNLSSDLDANHLDELRLLLAKQSISAVNKRNVFMPEKIVLLGNHGVGKSHLATYLKSQQLKDSNTQQSTHILSVLSWDAGKLHQKLTGTTGKNKPDYLPIMIYDFGGQDFYHGLYQCFSSSHAVHLVVYDSQQRSIEQKPDANGRNTLFYPLNYWLKEKQYLETDNHSDDLFIIENKIDTNKPAYSLDKPALSQDYLKGQFHVILHQKHHDAIALGDQEKQASQERSGKLKRQNLRQLNALRQQVVDFAYKAKEISIYEQLLLNFCYANANDKDEVHIHPLRFYFDIGNFDVDSFLADKTKQQQKHFNDLEWLKKKNMLTQLRVLERSGVLLVVNINPQQNAAGNDSENYDDFFIIGSPQAFITQLHGSILSADKQADNSPFKGRFTEAEWQKNCAAAYEKCSDEQQKRISEQQYVDLVTQFLCQQNTLFFDEKCQKSGNEYNYIMPNFLSLYQDDDERLFLTIQEQKACSFTLAYDGFIPFGVINQWVAHFGQEPNKKKFWRDAIYFIQSRDEKSDDNHQHEPEAHVFLRLDIVNLKIHVYVEAINPDFNKTAYLRYLWHCFAAMYSNAPLDWHESLRKDKNRRMEYTGAQLPETTRISLDDNYFIGLKQLSQAIDSNHRLITAQTLGDTPLSKNLPLHDFQFTTHKTLSRMKKLFISYSKQDVAYIHTFERHLAALKREGLIASWYCSDLGPGVEWDEKIQRELDQADIACFMVSEHFVSNDYIVDKEFKAVLKRYNKNKDVLILPIILDYIDWLTIGSDAENPNQQTLGSFCALPYTAKPVASFSNPNKAWWSIATTLRYVLENDAGFGQLANPEGEQQEEIMQNFSSKISDDFKSSAQLKKFFESVIKEGPF